MQASGDHKSSCAVVSLFEITASLSLSLSLSLTTVMLKKQTVKAAQGRNRLFCLTLMGVMNIYPNKKRPGFAHERCERQMRLKASCKNGSRGACTHDVSRFGCEEEETRPDNQCSALFLFSFCNLSLILSSKPSRQWQSWRDDNSSTWTGFDLFCEKKTSGATEMDAPQDNLTLKWWEEVDELLKIVSNGSPFLFQFFAKWRSH